MLRWQGSVQANRDPRQASADIPINPNQFTEVIPELPQSGWRQKASTIGSALYCIYLGAYAVLVFTSAWLPMLTPINHAPIFALCNFVMLAITGLLQQHLRKQLRKERDQGFLQFSSDLEWVAYLPFKVVAYGTGSILVVVAWDLQEELDIPHLHLLRLVTLLQILFAAALVGTFIRRVRDHNLTHCEPDAMHSLLSPLQPPESLRGIRYVERGGLVEQQAALLDFQLDNLQHLYKELFRLQKRSTEYEQSQDGNTTPLVDLVNLVDSREQELRAIAAERDLLQEEVRVARSLIGGRESDLLAARSENDKYVEENEGLRAELDEWSVRTAKFEVALEAERLRNLVMQRQYLELQQSGDTETLFQRRPNWSEYMEKLSHEQLVNMDAKPRVRVCVLILRVAFSAWDTPSSIRAVLAEMIGYVNHYYNHECHTWAVTAAETWNCAQQSPVTQPRLNDLL